MSAASTCCTRPPAPRPNAATPCSRPPSRRYAGSVSVPGASARSPPPRSSCFTACTTAPHDQRARPFLTGKGSLPERPSGMTLQVQVGDLDRAREFYGALLGAGPEFEPHDDFLEW